jgi:uncharacterized protein with NAD-binding domain and iron-sulfur cluster
MSGQHVVILGSGVAGLVAGYELSRRGTKVTVLEAAPFPGGRTSSYKDGKGREVSTGLHVVADHYVNLLEILAEIGALRHLKWVSVHTYLRAGRPPLDWTFSNRRPPFHLLRPSLTMPISPRERIALGIAAAKMASYSQEDLFELDDITYGEWHRRHRLGSGFLLDLADAAADATTFLGIEDAAARPVTSWIKYMVRHKSAGDVALFKGSLRECLVAPLVRAIEAHGGEVRVGTAAVGLTWDGRRVSGVRAARTATVGPCTNASGVVPLAGDPPEEIPADFVIAALPVQSLRTLLTPEEAKNAGLRTALRLTTTPGMSLLVWFDKPITPVPPGAPLVTGAAMRDFVDLATLGRQPAGARGAVYEFVMTRVRERLGQPDEQIARDAVADLNRVWPGSKQAKMIDFAVERIEAAMFAALPGAHALRPGTRCDVPNLFLAGDWLRHELNASMEGATVSGLHATAAVLRELGSGGVTIRTAPDPTVVPFLSRMRKRIAWRDPVPYLGSAS